MPQAPTVPKSVRSPKSSTREKPLSNAPESSSMMPSMIQPSPSSSKPMGFPCGAEDAAGFPFVFFAGGRRRVEVAGIRSSIIQLRCVRAR
ncbi:MAG: hypothetical protein BWY76_01004 [bacterium ADurb.Bin429]|nr:MAG: hypothetical protein BWY76_01004 [bacterium ADurb.Bin429]